MKIQLDFPTLWHEFVPVNHSMAKKPYYSLVAVANNGTQLNTNNRGNCPVVDKVTT